jgi:hypothetical protein
MENQNFKSFQEKMCEIHESLYTTLCMDPACVKDGALLCDYCQFDHSFNFPTHSKTISLKPIFSDKIKDDVKDFMKKAERIHGDIDSANAEIVKKVDQHFTAKENELIDLFTECQNLLNKHRQEAQSMLKIKHNTYDTTSVLRTLLEVKKSIFSKDLSDITATDLMNYCKTYIEQYQQLREFQMQLKATEEVKKESKIIQYQTPALDKMIADFQEAYTRASLVNNEFKKSEELEVIVETYPEFLKAIQSNSLSLMINLWPHISPNWETVTSQLISKFDQLQHIVINNSDNGRVPEFSEEILKLCANKDVKSLKLSCTAGENKRFEFLQEDSHVTLGGCIDLNLSFEEILKNNLESLELQYDKENNEAVETVSGFLATLPSLRKLNLRMRAYGMNHYSYWNSSTSSLWETLKNMKLLKDVTVMLILEDVSDNDIKGIRDNIINIHYNFAEQLEILTLGVFKRNQCYSTAASEQNCKSITTGLNKFYPKTIITCL